MHFHCKPSPGKWQFKSQDDPHSSARSLTWRSSPAKAYLRADEPTQKPCTHCRMIFAARVMYCISQCFKAGSGDFCSQRYCMPTPCSPGLQPLSVAGLRGERWDLTLALWLRWPSRRRVEVQDAPAFKLNWSTLSSPSINGWVIHHEATSKMFRPTWRSSPSSMAMFLAIDRR